MKLGLSNTRIVFFLATLMIIGIVISSSILFSDAQNYLERSAEQKAKMLSKALGDFRVLYTSEVVSRLEAQGIEVTHDYKNTEGAIPLPATMTELLASKVGTADEGQSARLYSDYPFPWKKDGGVKDTFEQDALTALKENPTVAFHRIDMLNGVETYRYATADVMQKSCVNCHNTHPQTPKRDWKEGDVRGVLEVSFPMSHVIASSDKSTLTHIIMTSLLTLSSIIIMFGSLFTLATERKKLKQRIKENSAELLNREQNLIDEKSRLSAVIDNAVDGIITIDEQGLIETYNQAAMHLFGYSAEEVIAKNIKMLMPQPYKNEHDGYLSNYRNTKVAKIIGIGREVVGLRKDGSTFPMELSVAEVKLADRRVFSGIVRDITERISAEEKEKGLREEFEGVFSSVIDGLITIDEKGTIDAYNPAAENIFGYSKEEVKGQNVKMLMPEPYRGEHDGYLEHYASTGERKIIGMGREVTGRCKDGRTFPMDLAVSPMLVGEKKMFVGLVRDITHRKLVEKELRVAQLAAESANQMKSEFLANMSHELRTPLNAIIGYSELLREEAEEDGSEEIVKDLNRIHTAGNHLLKLINDVLDLAKIEAGRVELAHEQISVFGLLKEIEVVIGHQMDINANHFEITCDENIGDIIGDSGRVRQVLLNLLSNAAKFTSKGKVDLVVTKEHLKGQDQIRFTVSDTGIGMTPDQVEKVFIPFVQADASTTRQYGGTGLGLSICKDLCEIMGGTIEASSEKDKGSTFSFHIPVDTSVARDEEDVAHVAKDLSSISSYMSGYIPMGESILVIDDDEETRNLIIRTLEKNGFSVAAAANGKEGIEMAITLKPMAIILDIMMPKLDGWEVLSILKKSPDTSGIPVIINTIADVVHKESKEVLAYLSKPLKKDQLLEKLNELSPLKKDADVLVVEDEPDLRNLLLRQLSNAGWNARECANGLEAIDIVKQKMPDLILLDLMMPKMDGFEFLSELRLMPEGLLVPVVILTAKDISEEESVLLDTSAQMVITKGDLKNIDDLIPVVRRFTRSNTSKGV